MASPPSRYSSFAFAALLLLSLGCLLCSFPSGAAAQSVTAYRSSNCSASGLGTVSSVPTNGSCFPADGAAVFSLNCSRQGNATINFYSDTQCQTVAGQGAGPADNTSCIPLSTISGQTLLYLTVSCTGKRSAATTAHSMSAVLPLTLLLLSLLQMLAAYPDSLHLSLLEEGLEAACCLLHGCRSFGFRRGHTRFHKFSHLRIYSEQLSQASQPAARRTARFSALHKCPHRAINVLA
jgi:hypothetical protein